MKGGLDKSSAVLEHVDAAARRAGARKVLLIISAHAHISVYHLLLTL